MTRQVSPMHSLSISQRSSLGEALLDFHSTTWGVEHGKQKLSDLYHSISTQKFSKL
jgi:hypothetical protein